jgi:hypothetical protein
MFDVGGFSLSPGATTIGITQTRLYPVNAPIGTSEYVRGLMQKIFFATPEQIRSGEIRFGTKGDISSGNGWDRLVTAWYRTTATGTGWRYWNPVYALLSKQTEARAWSQASLPQIISEALSWYIFNHNVWYASKLGFTPEQLRAQQRALTSAGLDRTSGPIVGVVGAVGSAINPAIGVVVGIINAIGKELLLSFVQIAPDTPKPLFLRIPDPAVCEGRPEEQANRPSPPVPGPTDEREERESSSFPIVPVAAAIAVAVVLFAASRKKSKLGEYDDEAEEYIWTAKDSLERSRWYKKPRAEDDTRKGSVRFDRIPAKPGEKHGTPIIIIDESFDCKDLNDTIDDLKFAMDDLDEVQQSDDENGTDYAYALWWKLDRQIERVRRLARANGCTTISGLRRRT